MLLARQEASLPGPVPIGGRARNSWRQVRARLFITSPSSDTSGNLVQPLVQPAARSVKDDCERFILAHEREILNYLWRMTGNRESAYDLTQEVFLRAWQRYDAIRNYDQPRHWLFRVATNLAITYLRRRSSPIGSAGVLDSELDPATSDPAWRLAERDLVRETLLKLSPKPRAALVLREVYGMSAAEAGKILGMSEAAVRMALHRGREQFRALYLGEEGGRHGAR